MKTCKKLLALIIIACTFTSCEYFYTYTYTVKNSTDTTIAVHIKTYKSDTTYLIAHDSVAKIYVTDHGVEGGHPGGSYFRDVNKDLDTLTVVKKNILSTRNYRDNNTWVFDNSTGVYATEVKNNEF